MGYRFWALGLAGAVAVSATAIIPSVGVPIPAPPRCTSIEASQDQHPPLSTERLHQLAQTITVRVVSPAVMGSGVLVGRRGNIYQVLTNAHNLIGTDRATAITADGREHEARRIPRQSWGKTDLALLEFYAEQTYAVAERAPQVAHPGQPVAVAGFEFDRADVTVTEGAVSQILEQPLRNGYQLGYVSTLHQGMSGGPILNRQGQLLGVNAMTAYPLVNRAYVFSDGSRPPAQTVKQLRRSNWGIPLRTNQSCLSLSR
jgi:S1-C subfamily serine protease